MVPDWRAIKSSCSDEGMDWEDVKFFGPAVVEELKQCWSKCSSGLLSICRSMRCDNTIVMAWNGACSRPDFLHLYQICSANKWYRHQSTWDAPSLSHQSIPLVNRWSRLVVYLLKACSSEFPKIQKQNHQSQSSSLVAFTSIQVRKPTKALPNALWLESWVFLQASIWGGQSYHTYEVVGAIWSSECFWMLMF